LGELLLRTGKVSEADLERAIAMQRERHGALRMGEILVEIGAISQRELERQMRFQVEEVVFELLSWNEGFFSFEEGSGDELLPEVTVAISTESLLMEGARRIDEWSRIASRIPDLALIVSLADIPDDRAPQLDLLPNEWEVLSMVDGQRTVRQIALALGKSEFDVAKVLYGLVCTGVVVVTESVPQSPGGGYDSAAVEGSLPMDIIMHANDGHARLEAARTRARTGRAAEAIADLRLLLRADPGAAPLHRELAFAQVKAGLLSEAIASWRRVGELELEAESAAQLRELVRHTEYLLSAMDTHYNG
jgi:hypothetical protein